MSKEKEPLFSKKNRALLTDPLDDDNPITVQVLGICSALAITVKLEPAVVMTLSVIFVMAAGNVTVSILRNVIPTRIRIIVQLLVVATLVALVDPPFLFLNNFELRCRLLVTLKFLREYLILELHLS